MIRLLVVDDHQILRLGLTLFFETCDDFELVGEAENGQQAVELCDELRPDVVLMDVHMPVMDGIRATRIIMQRHPQVCMVILTYSPGVDPQQAIAAGAQMVLTKTVSGDTLAQAIRAAVA